MMSSSSPSNREEILSEFRRQIEEEGKLKPGDSIGTDDDTLLYVDDPQLCSAR